MFYWVYVIGHHHLVLPDKEVTFDTQQNLAANGLELIWDSAPSEFKGAQYAAQFYGAPVPIQRTVVA